MTQMLILQLSPRKSGTSKRLASMCSEYLMSNEKQVNLIEFYSNLDKIDMILREIEKSDTIILCGPCYINHYPADTIFLLEQINENKNILHNQNVYGIIQGGMPYIHTHESGIKTLELFCEDLNITFKGAFVIGMGAMLDGKPLDKLPNGRKVKKNYLLFLQHIVNGEHSSDELYQKAQLKLPTFLYRMLAKRMNDTIDKDLADRGIDLSKPSPYWK